MKTIFKTIIIVSFSYFFCGVITAQDVSFSQPYNTQLLVNPSLMGLNQDLTVSTAYRSEWTGIENGFQTIRFSAVSPVLWNDAGKLDAGIYFLNDKAGAFTTNDFGLAGSYALHLDKFNMFTVGLGAGYKSSSIDAGSLTFGDQYIHGVFDVQDETNEAISENAVSIVDASFGLLWNFSTANDSLHIFAGLSGYHFYSPTMSFVQNSEAELLARYNYVMGLKIRTLHNLDFAPQYMAIWQGADVNHFAGAYVDYHLNFGGGSSMIDDEKNDLTSQAQVTLGTWYNIDASTISCIIGLKYENYCLAYSYGFAGSRVKETAFDMGNNEISLTYLLNRTGKKKISPVSLW